MKPAFAAEPTHELPNIKSVKKTWPVEEVASRPVSSRLARMPVAASLGSEAVTISRVSCTSVSTVMQLGMLKPALGVERFKPWGMLSGFACAELTVNQRSMASQKSTLPALDRCAVVSCRPHVRVHHAEALHQSMVLPYISGS